MHVILFFQKSFSNVMQMHIVGEIPAEKMRSYISKTIYMSIAHYSPVLDVIAAQLWMNSWNNKIHWVAVTEFCGLFNVCSSSFRSLPNLKRQEKIVKKEGGEDIKNKIQISCLECYWNIMCKENMQHYNIDATKPFI